MADILRPEEFCTHDGGTIVMMSDDTPRCGDCHTPMVWVARKDLEALRRTPTEKEQQLQQALMVKTAALLRIRQNLMEVGVW